MAQQHVVIIGAGFCGLAAAWELVQRGIKVTVLEQDDEVGGLAGSFSVGETRLEKFYHHWFTSDVHVMQLIDELGLQDRLVLRATRTGMYYAHNFFSSLFSFRCAAFSCLATARSPAARMARATHAIGAQLACP